VILCPETNLENTILLAKRIAQAVKERTNLHVLWGVAAFPEEALTFEDLLQKASERLIHSDSLPKEQASVPVSEGSKL
jgi:hypothetical protein